MKKIVYVLAFLLIILCGCDTNLNNTPTRQAEIFLGKYQTLHQDILTDLDISIKNDNRLKNYADDYRNIMKKHYQDLEYEILEEKIDGDNAIVTVKIEVDDYRSIDTKAMELYKNNQKNDNDEIVTNDDKENNIIENNNISNNIPDNIDFMKYRIDAMKNNKDRITYTIYLTFSKKNKKWVIDSPNEEVLNKINGIYE